MKQASSAVVGVLVCGLVGAGLLAWGKHRDAAKRREMAKDDPTIEPIGLFPALRVGDIVIVDSSIANLPAPFSSSPRVPCEVDLVLQDPAVVSVKSPPHAVRGTPGIPFFSGTIPKAAIMSVIPPISFEV